MTPQERALVQDLLDRLARLEDAARDRDAERAIEAGLRQAPNALYALVQTALVQEEALKAADARIRELEGGAEPQEQNRGFLDTMRDTLFGREGPQRGSVPSVPAQDRGGQSPWVPMQNRPTGGPPWGAPQPGAPGPYAGYQQPAPEPSRGGSFLGTAAASAAGVIGGALLLNSIRSAFGSHSQGPFQGALDPHGGGRDSAPWGGSSGGELSRQAGLDDIGRSGGGGFGSGEGRAAGAFDFRAGDRDASQDQYASAQDESYDDSGSDDDFDGGDFGGGDDTSEA